MLSHDDNDFSKQRRNLILVSAVILAKNYLDIDYSQLEVFAKGITIGNPDGIKIILWILWIYFFVRYFSLFFEIKNKFLQPLKDQLSILLKKDIEKNTQRKWKDENLKISYTPNIFTPRYSVFNNAKQRTSNELNLKKDYKITECKFHRLIALSLFNYTFKSHCFFEYFFPILFSFSPILMLLI